MSCRILKCLKIKSVFYKRTKYMKSVVKIFFSLKNTESFSFLVNIPGRWTLTDLSLSQCTAELCPAGVRRPEEM